MTPAERISRTLRQPAIYVSRKGDAMSRWQFLASAVRPKPVSLTPPLPERRADQ